MSAAGQTTAGRAALGGALLAGLIDYAGLFPPARKPLDAARAAYAEAVEGPIGWLVGRFLCPASLVGELPAGHGWRLGVVGDGAWEADLDRAVAAGADAFELRDPGEDAYDRLGAAPCAVFVEGARSVEALRAAGLGGKIRCGGTTRAAFPDDATVVAAIDAHRRAGVPLKGTAGLHHPFRRTDPATGALQHGFVNLLLAAGLPEEQTAAVVAETDPDAFAVGAERVAWRDRALDAAAVARARRLFVAYGSCNVMTPADDLRSRGIDLTALRPPAG